MLTASKDNGKILKGVSKKDYSMPEHSSPLASTKKMKSSPPGYLCIHCKYLLWEIFTALNCMCIFWGKTKFVWGFLAAWKSLLLQSHRWRFFLFTNHYTLNPPEELVSFGAYQECSCLLSESANKCKYIDVGLSMEGWAHTLNGANEKIMDKKTISPPPFWAILVRCTV